MDIAELEKQVTRQEDILEIEQLQMKYGYYFDTQRFQDVVDLFSENTESAEITDHGLFLGKKGVRMLYLDWIGANIGALPSSAVLGACPSNSAQ